MEMAVAVTLARGMAAFGSAFGALALGAAFLLTTKWTISPAKRGRGECYAIDSRRIHRDSTRQRPLVIQ